MDSFRNLLRPESERLLATFPAGSIGELGGDDVDSDEGPRE